MSRADWTMRAGVCVICSKRGRVIGHHIVTRRHVEREGGDVWDPRNRMWVGAPYAQGGRCHCHANHHNAHRRIPLAFVRDEAIDFAVDLLGYDRAALYFARYYDAGAATTEEDPDAPKHHRLVDLRPRA